MSADRDRVLSQLLLVRYQRGDHAALDELTRLWNDTLFYYVMRLVSNEEDAWDVLQETWLSFIRNIGSLRKPDAMIAWLYKIARNKAMNRLKQRYQLPTTPIDCEEITDAGTGFDDFENADIVHNAMDKLSLPHREVLTLFFLKDLSMEEISQVLDVSVGTIKSRLFHAKRALGAVLQKEGLYE